MKSLILVLGILSLFSFTNIDTVQREKLELRYISVDCKYSQCQSTAKSTGNQCKHCVSNSGDTYCYQHD